MAHTNLLQVHKKLKVLRCTDHVINAERGIELWV